MGLVKDAVTSPLIILEGRCRILTGTISDMHTQSILCTLIVVMYHPIYGSVTHDLIL